MRFIHLADVHLGAVPDRGCPWSKEREEEIWSTFRRVGTARTARAIGPDHERGRSSKGI